MRVYLKRSPAGNETTVSTGGVDLYFSYETVVAFNAGDGLVVSENVWSVTTSEHLNRIDGGSAEAKRMRRPYSEFTNQLERI